MKRPRLPTIHGPTDTQWRGIAYLSGILLVGYGGWLLEPAAGFIGAGIALILTIRPVRRWWD